MCIYYCVNINLKNLNLQNDTLPQEKIIQIILNIMTFFFRKVVVTMIRSLGARGLGEELLLQSSSPAERVKFMYARTNLSLALCQSKGIYMYKCFQGKFGFS